MIAFFATLTTFIGKNHLRILVSGALEPFQQITAVNFISSLETYYSECQDFKLK